MGRDDGQILRDHHLLVQPTWWVCDQWQAMPKNREQGIWRAVAEMGICLPPAHICTYTFTRECTCAHIHMDKKVLSYFDSFFKDFPDHKGSKQSYLELTLPALVKTREGGHLCINRKSVPENSIPRSRQAKRGEMQKVCGKPEQTSLIWQDRQNSL